ncbi:MAG: PD-(D/E)XK nuclease family protein [Deltaproteobacteria bacterium]|nr:PD-(D/E)XK nuclease family protein [Deltaproteobacteria bacterium]
MIHDELDFLDRERIILVEPGVDLQEIIADLLVCSDHDFSMNVVVYPGRRPAHYLRSKIGMRLNRPFIPPKIYSMDDFVLNLHAKLFGLRPIDFFDSILIIHRICIRHGLINGNLLDLDNFFPLGVKILSVLEELYIERIPCERLRDIDLLIDVPSRSTKNLHFLSTVYSLFYREIENLGLSTRAKRYADLSECEDMVDHLYCERLIMCGFFAFTKAEKQIVKILSRKNGFLLVRQKKGKIVSEEREIHIYSAPDLHGEVKIVGEILKKLDDLEGVCIVLPKSDTLFPLIRQGISYLREDDYNVSMGYPLSRTPIYGFFNNLFEVIETSRELRVYIPSYLKFLLHPYTKNIELKKSSELGRIVIHAVETTLKRETPLAFADLSWIENDLPSKLKRFTESSGITEEDAKEYIKHIHSNLLKPFLQIKDVSDFFQKCASVLSFIYNKSTARYHPLFYPYAESYLREFKKIVFSFFADHAFEHYTSYFNLFKRMFSSSFFPFEGAKIRGLQILGFLETRNLKFNTVIFLDTNEGVIPDISDDFLLPYKVRLALGLSTLKERESLIYHYFNTLLCKARDIHILYVENQENEKSRFLQKIIWELEKKNGHVIEERSLIKSLTYKVHLSNPIPSPIYKSEDVMKTVEKIFFTPSSLDDYLKCGILFYFRHVLKIGEEETFLDEMDRTTIGEMVHLVLQRFFSRKLYSYLKIDHSYYDEIRGIVDDVFNLRQGHFIDGKAYITKVQIERRMTDFLNFLFGILKKDRIKVIGVEAQNQEEIFGTQFRFKIDLVQERNGSTEILDFKTSGDANRFIFSPRRMDPSDRKSYFKLPTLQIPLYILLYAKKYSMDSADVRGFYVVLGEKILKETSFVDPFKNVERETGMAFVKEVIGKIIREIKDPEIPFSPPIILKETCPYCQYKPICGTLWVSAKVDY